MAVSARMIAARQSAIRQRPPQFGDDIKAAQEAATRQLTRYIGPIPGYLYSELPDGELANQIKNRFIAKRMQMAPRILLDLRLLRWYDPERIQDHWQNVWTGEPLPKMRHATGLSAMTTNWTKPITEALVGLLAGGDPMAYDIDVQPRSTNESEADNIHADVVEDWLYREIRRQKYRITYQDRCSDLITLGRSVKYVRTDPRTLLVTTENLWPGRVAFFWKDDMKTVEQVTIQSEITVGEAVRMFPQHKEEIINAVVGPSSTGGSYASESYSSSGLMQDPRSWAFYSHATFLTNYWRNENDSIGCAIVLLNGSNPSTGLTPLLMEKQLVTKLTDIPAICTPRFKTPNRPPDEAKGVLWDLAGLTTEYEEAISGYRDMLWRVIYARYKAKLFSKAPKLAKGTSIYPLPRAGQDIERIDDVVNIGPMEQFLTRLEEMIIVFPGLNRYFLGSAPPSETSGEAITASINASINRMGPIRTNIAEDELWMFGQWVDQANAYTVLTDPATGKDVPMSMLLEGGGFPMDLLWLSDAPKDAIKEKQLALAGLAKKVISRRTTQRAFRVKSYVDEDRRIRREAQDPILWPEAVTATASAMLAALNAKATQQKLATPPSKGGPDVRVSLSGMMSPEGVAAAEEAIGLPAAPGVPPKGSVSTSLTGAMDRAKAAALAGGKIPAFENQNGEGGIAPPTDASSVGNESGPPPAQ